LDLFFFTIEWKQFANVIEEVYPVGEEIRCLYSEHKFPQVDGHLEGEDALIGLQTKAEM